MPKQFFVIVTGLPASGKTTLAVALAVELQLPLFAKDDIKETLGEFLPFKGREGSSLLGRASVEVLWTLANRAPAAVLESYWYPEFTVPRLATFDADVVEVFCDAPRSECIDRFRMRMITSRHPVHQEHSLSDHELDAVLNSWPEAAPLGVGHLVRVCTTKPVDIQRVAAAVLPFMRS